MSNHSRTVCGLGLRSFALLLDLLIAAVVGALCLFALRAYYVPAWQTGEYGADLRLLNQAYTPPQTATESNFVIDMLKSGSFTEFLRIHGLTNNHALFVLSHGRALSNSFAGRYAYYPDERVTSFSRVPYYSARDLARIVGPVNAAKVHNVILAGCNLEGAFDPAEIRRFFVNATNVTHTPAGKNGYEFVFRHCIIHSSEGIKMLYQMPDSFAVGDFTKNSPVAHHRAGLSAYTAVLYEPGALQPFSTRTAGRELLGCTESQLLARNSSVQNNAHMPDSAALSSILSKAISSPKAEVKTPDTRRKPFILIQARGSSPPETYTARIHALAGYLNCACLSFLGVWHGPILSGLFSILFCRLGISCLSLALRKPEKDPAFTLIDVSPLPEIPGGESGFNPG